MAMVERLYHATEIPLIPKQAVMISGAIMGEEAGFKIASQLSVN
jgi:hypothetical protein